MGDSQAARGILDCLQLLERVPAEPAAPHSVAACAKHADLRDPRPGSEPLAGSATPQTPLFPIKPYVARTVGFSGPGLADADDVSRTA